MPVAQKCQNCLIHKTGICNFVDGATHLELKRYSHFRSYAEGETVFSEGVETGIVGHVVSGTLKLVSALADGRQHIVGLIQAGEMFGRVFDGNSPFAIEAATDATLCCFEQRVFDTIVVRNPKLEQELLLVTLDELDAARDWIMLLGCQHVIERVATFLLLVLRHQNQIANAHTKQPAPPIVTFPINRRDIAAYLGTTTETISRSLHTLAQQGMIRIVDHQSFEITQVKALTELAGREDILTLPRKHMNPAVQKLSDQHQLLLDIDELTTGEQGHRD